MNVETHSLSEKLIYSLEQYHKNPITTYGIRKQMCKALIKETRLTLLLLILLKKDLIVPTDHRESMQNVINI